MIRFIRSGLIFSLLLLTGTINIASAEGLRGANSIDPLSPKGSWIVDWTVKLLRDNIDSDNTPPVAAGDTYGTSEDTVLVVGSPGVLANDTDVEGDALTAVLVNEPSHGALVLNGNGGFTYTPAANYSGTDQFTYRASDGQAFSNEATVSLTVDVKRPQPPTWIEPVENNGFYVLRTDSVVLGVTVADSDVSYVLFRGYNHLTGNYYDIGGVFTPPYQTSLARSSLVPDAPNQIFAEVVDDMGNSSLNLEDYEATVRRIIIDPTSLRFQIFLPVVSR